MKIMVHKVKDAREYVICAPCNERCGAGKDTEENHTHISPTKAATECKKEYIPQQKNTREKCQKKQTRPTMEKPHKTPQNTQKVP